MFGSFLPGVFLNPIIKNMRSKNRFVHAFPALLALACAFVAPAFAGESADSSEVLVSESPSLWFIEFAGQPTASGGKKADLKRARDAFAAAAKAAGADYTKRYEFETLWNGISVRVTPSNLSRITRLPEVVNVWPVDTYMLPEPGGENSVDLFTAIAMSGADVVQGAGITGAGIKIGIIDTGVDIDHPDFGGTGVPGTTPFPNAKIVAGWDFVGDDYDANPGNATYNPVPSPDPNPDDCGGHGTHVAGIAAANGVVKGVAPGASLGAYRVFGCNGSTDSDIMIAAMERAYLDGMNVVNMSIGAAFQSWPQYPTAVAGDRLVARGVVVACSIGNSGTSGLYANGAPGVGYDVIGTANFLNSHLNNIRVFTISPDNLQNGYLPATGAPAAPTSGTFPMARTGTATTGNDACNAVAPAPGSLAGKIALIRRGTCSFYEKAFNAQAAGAIGVVIYNNTAGWINPTVAGTPAITIPVVAVSDAEGLVINNRLASGPVDLTWTDVRGTFPNGAGGVIDSSSSYGVAADLSLKPDIGAPGGNIYSTYPLEQGGYTTISGTSMASPHIAGSAALLLQAHPGLSASAVRGILQNSADPRPWSGNPGLGFLDQTHRQGAGLVRIDRAIAATTRVTPGKLSLGEAEGSPVTPITKTLTFWNGGASPVTYNLSHTPALSTGPNTFAVSAVTGFASVAFSAPSVEVPAGGVATVDVTVTGNAGLGDKSLFGGYIVATPQGGGEALRVPYSGFKGDYQSIQVLAPTTSTIGPFPALGITANGSSFGRRPADANTYTMEGFDIPFILVHLDHPSRTMKVDLFEAATGAPVHPVFYNAWTSHYNSRNSTATGFFALAWDGTRQHNNGKGNDYVKVLPNGDYIMKLSVLKANGDAANPAHWETWTSPVVTIARP